MRFIIIILLLIAAHFSLTPFAPAPAEQAWLLWPFAVDSKPWLDFISELPRQSGRVLISLLAGSAALGFLVAPFGLFGLIIPVDWWRPLVVISALASLLLYLLYPGRWSLLPIALDVILLWGGLNQIRSVTELRDI